MKPSESKISELLYKCFKNPELLKELKKNPKQFIEKELNIKLPENYDLQALEETQEKGFLVIPWVGKIQECSDEELRALAGGAGTIFGTCDCLTEGCGR